MFSEVETLSATLTQLLGKGGWRSLPAMPATAASDPYLSRLGKDASFWRGLPWLSLACSQRWLGDRLFFFPQPVSAENRIGVVSSRFRQRLDLETRWFDLLRTTVLRCDSLADVLLTVNTTTAHESIVRAAVLFDRPIAQFVTATKERLEDAEGIADWLNEIASTNQQSCEDQTRERSLNIYVSPVVSPRILPATDDQMFEDGMISNDSLPDRLLFAAASRIHVLSARRNGNVANLLKLHLEDSGRNTTPVLIAADEEDHLSGVTSDLPTSWVPWLVEPPQPTRSEANDNSIALLPSTVESDRSAPQKIIDSSPLNEPDAWLTHWTRAARGPWPGETHNDYLDALILRTETADRSAMASLLRIVSKGILVASSDGIRGGHKVVAFTEVPLHEFRSRRVFRKHRNRFDFEPWGVAIKKSELARLGALPVIYGDGREWDELDRDQQPFFQKAPEGSATDNRAEREWRVCGDIHFRLFEKNSVCIFVESDSAALLIQRHCEWPVIVVPDDDTQF